MADESQKALTPAYPAFSTLKTLIRPFKEHGVPNRIDRSVLTSFSGQVGSQVLGMLRFLDLIDANGTPKKGLHDLTEAFETDDWPRALREVLEAAYAPLFSINLDTATAHQFNEHFRLIYPVSDEVSRKAMTFFLNAVREAGYKISPYVLKGKKPRTAPAKKRAPRGAKKANANGQNNGANNPRNEIPPVQTQKLPSEILLNLFDGEMGTGEQDAIWTLIKYYKAKGK